MVVNGESADGDPSLGISSWEEAITGMIDDEFNDDTLDAENAIADVFGGDGPPPASDDAGPPENILQPASEESSPLIILESLESGGRADSASDDGDVVQQDNSACLDVVSSGSSKGSQGSYADQVPSLSLSGSTGGQAAEEEEAKRSELGSPWTLPGDDNSDSSNGDRAAESAKESLPVLVDTPPIATDMLFVDPEVPPVDSGVRPAEGSARSRAPEISPPKPSPLQADPQKCGDIEKTTELSRETKSDSEPNTPKGTPQDTSDAKPDGEPVAEHPFDITPDEDVAGEPSFDARDDESGENISKSVAANETSGTEIATGQPFDIAPKEDVAGEQTLDVPDDELKEDVSKSVDASSPCGFDGADEQESSPEQESKSPARKDTDGEETADKELESQEAEDILCPDKSEEETGEGKSKVLKKPAKVTPNLTIKTSFSSEPPTVEEDHHSNDSEDDIKEGASIMSNVSDMVQRFTEVKAETSEDLDDILGAKGQPAVPVPPSPAHPTAQATTTPQSDVAGIYSLRSDRTDQDASFRSHRTDPSNRSDRTNPILSAVSEASESSEVKRSSDPALLAASQKELDALTSAKEEDVAPQQSPEPSLAELQSKKQAGANPLDQIVASLEKHEAEQHTRPIHRTAEQNQRTLIGPGHTASADTTFDSPSFHTSASGTPMSGVSKGSDQEGGSYWSNSADASESNVGSSVGESYSHAGTSMVSPTGTSVAGTDVSRMDTLSPGATSVSASMTNPTLSTRGTDTFHTRDTYHSNVMSLPETPMSHGGASLSDRASISHSETERTERTETERTRADRSDLHIVTSAESDATEESEGGRLWQLANQEAARMRHAPLTPESSRFAESLMARTRSRADPDALISGSASLDRDSDPPNMVKIGEEDEEKFIVHTALARKRVRVVQLLIVGLLALLVSFLGNLWIQSSCHFVSAAVEVGERGQEFDLHFGLWKYSPIDSAFQGYSYCFQYDDEYTTDAPLLSRWFSGFALVGGSFSLAVLWIYLIFGRGNRLIWSISVAMAALAGVLQLGTLIILAGPVCQRDECKLGPAGILSIVAGAVYFILAFEMHYNTPMATWVTELAACPSNEQPGNLMAGLEMTDFKHGAKAYVSRIVAGDDGPYKSLNQMQRTNKNPIGEAMLDRDLANRGNAYRPPALIV